MDDMTEKRNQGDFDSRRRRPCCIALAAAVFLLASGALKAQEYGRISGRVRNRRGVPLMGATVIITGPQGSLSAESAPLIERIITDAHGEFVAAHLFPGWYSLRALAPARVPEMRNHVLVKPGLTVQQQFVLANVLSPLHFRVPKPDVSTWGNDWKWILRTSSSTRPLLRFTEDEPTEVAEQQPANPPKSSTQKLIAVLPRPNVPGGMNDSGVTSVLAYSQPLGLGSDLLLAGSLVPGAGEAASFAAAYRRESIGNSGQQVSLVVHQLSLEDAVPVAMGGLSNGQLQAQGVALGYEQNHRLSKQWTLRTGVEIDYLNGAQDTGLARPRVALDFQPSGAARLSFSYGAPSAAPGDDQLVNRIATLDQFPNVTMKGSRLTLENVRHAQATFDRSLAGDTEIFLAVYHDDLSNTALWGFGPASSANIFLGDLLLNPSSGGFILNSGGFKASGVQAAYVRFIGKYARIAIAYNNGQALQEIHLPNVGEPTAEWKGNLATREVQSVSAKVTAYLPVCRTQVVASYGSMPRGALTAVDPYTNGPAQVQPFMGLQVRQPIPILAFIPVRLEAIADFQNILGQGAVPVVVSGNRPFYVVPDYRSFRGGFSVLF